MYNNIRDSIISRARARARGWLCTQDVSNNERENARRGRRAARLRIQVFRIAYKYAMPNYNVAMQRLICTRICHASCCAVRVRAS